MSIAACASGSVALTPPQPATARATAACETLGAALAERLPDGLLGQPRRDVAPQSSRTAAWGDPPITLRCGVPRPAALRAASQLLTVDGVAWFPEQLTNGYRFTTYGRVTNVEVDVPDDYAPEANALVALAAAIRSTTPTLR